MSEHYRVIIIGGRPAGASLAIWLGRHNIKTLLVDKAEFPSLPAVPSSPIIHPGTIDLLDELGIPENELMHPDGRVDSYVMEFLGHFNKVIPLSMAGAKRSYGYGADRNKFDTAIWKHAYAYASVTARSGFSVTGVIKENGKPTGIKGQSERGKEETFTADLVIGADGRFSMAAREFEAATLDEHNDYVTNSYHAEWENVPDGIAPRSVQLYNTAKGFLSIFIPIDTRKYIVVIYLRPELQDSKLHLEDYYMEALREIPEVWARLKDAWRVSSVVGVKGIKNGYRQPFGDGWALVGDALHYKDPLDGQGIYDALIEAKYLGEAIRRWDAGEASWEEAAQGYADRAWDATHAMMLHTVGRVKREMFSDPPPFIIKTLIRWLFDSPEYQRDFLRLICRLSDPTNWETPGLTRRAVMNGIANDLFGRKPTARLETAQQAR